MQDLNEKGFREQFQINETELVALSNKKSYQPDQLSILHRYRFDGMTNPSDESTLYAIKTPDGIKDTLVVSGNVHSEQEIIKNIPTS